MAGVEHGYFSQPSNRNASRLLGSPKWREANTATSESFLSGYFAKSRLHHLSTWKSQMQDMVAQALNDEAKGRERGSPDLPPLTPRVIMHIDFDSFFVTVGLRKRQDLKGKPVVVCHSTGGPSSASATTTTTNSSTSEIASCSYEARAFGVRNGMSLGQARKYCPQIQAIPYAFQEYHDTSIQLYSLLLSHADAIEAVSVDEALIDVSLLLRTLDSSGQQPGTDDDDDDLPSLYAEHRKTNPTSTPPTALANALRSQISSRTGCSASIGIGSNVLLARLATRKAKPGGVWHLEDQNALSFTSELDVDDLHGIGWHTRDDLRSKYGTINVGELRAVLTESKLNASLGPKQGSKVYKKLLGIDRDRLEGQKLRQSVGANVNYAIRFASQEEAKAFVHKLCIEVVARLKALKLKGKQVAVNVMVRAPDAPAEAPKFLGHGICDVHHRSISIQGSAIDSLELIEPKAWSLITSLQADPRELRGIGVSLHKLELAFPEGGGPMVSRPEKGQQLLTFGKSAMEARKLSSDPEAGTSDGPPAEDPVGTPPTLEEGRVEEDQPRLTSKDKGKAPMRDGDLDPTTTTSNHRPHPRPAPPLPPADELNQPAPEPSSSSYVNMPTMSQIDPDMLSELPDWARAEVLRDAELGRRLQGKRPRLDSLVEEEEEGEGLLNTPTKRRKVGGGTLFENMLRSGGSARTGSGGGDRQLKLTPSKRSSAPSTPQSSTTPRRRSHQQPTLNFVQDPTKMTDDEVRALEIDPAVWRALPLAIQRELVEEHSAAAAAAKSGPSRSGGGVGGVHEPVARGRLTNAIASGSGSGFGVLFKPGQVNKYPSRAEARKEAARKAARFAMPTTSKEEDVPLHILIANPATSPSSRPSLTTRTGTSVHTPHDIRALLSAWFDKRQTTLPRESEVRRIREYVLACVDLSSEEEEMPVVGSARWDVEGAVGALKWWRDLLLGVWPSFEAGGEAGCEENDIGVARAWWEKWTEVRDEVERRITQRLSYPIRI